MAVYFIVSNWSRGVAWIASQPGKLATSELTSGETGEAARIRLVYETIHWTIKYRYGNRSTSVDTEPHIVLHNPFKYLAAIIILYNFTSIRTTFYIGSSMIQWRKIKERCKQEFYSQIKFNVMKKVDLTATEQFLLTRSNSTLSTVTHKSSLNYKKYPREVQAGMMTYVYPHLMEFPPSTKADV